MANKETAPGEKKPRATKRNFAKTVSDVRTYAQMKVDVLTEVGGSEQSEFNKGRISELNAILGKLDAR